MLLLITATGIGFIGCDDDTNTYSTHSSLDSASNPYVNDGGGDYNDTPDFLYKSCEEHKDNEQEDDVFEYSVDGDVLHIKRVNWMSPCSLEEPSVKHEIVDDTLFVAENWGGNAGANCLCRKDIVYNIKNIPNGKYTVICSARCDNYGYLVTLFETVFSIIIE